LQTHFYAFIPKKPQEKAVLRRLGYHKQTVVDAADMASTRAMMRRAEDLCRPQAKTVIMPIAKRDAKSVTLDNGLTLVSAKLASLLKNAHSVLLMGATLAKNVVETINTELKSGDAVFAVVLDAYASECVDDALDFIMQAEARKGFNVGRRLTKHRFSAGYGDLDLSYQKDLFEILEMETMGVSITKTYMLIPEKSVIAICGVEGS